VLDLRLDILDRPNVHRDTSWSGIVRVAAYDRAVPRVRFAAGTALVLAIALGAAVVALQRDRSSNAGAAGSDARAGTRRAPAPSTSQSALRTTSTSTTVPHDPADDFRLVPVRTITGAISPKSVTASGTGLVFAQNMMYRHTVTVYDRDGSLRRTIPDSVELARFGISGHPGISRGAPVEAAVDAAHRYMFATNYSMYGAAFGPEGSDNCSGPAGLSPSYVYRINLKTLAIDKVAPVGMVPKYVAVTPDNRYVLVTNWCSYDSSILDARTLREVKRVQLGPYPRGIAVDPASRAAYVAVMGSYDIARIDLRTFGVSWFRGVGNSPRHLVLSRDGSRLFVTLNGADQVVAVDTATGRVVKRTTTGSQPRSMAISADGQALYVVNYRSNTVSILRASDLSVVRSVAVASHPIGIAYEPVAHRVWVACYSGEILLYDA
jgi:YVTN family beta-propeller protein